MPRIHTTDIPKLLTEARVYFLARLDAQDKGKAGHTKWRYKTDSERKVP